MFFELAKQVNPSFGTVFNLPNNLILNTDLGWNQFNIKNHHVVYKGYHLESFSDEELFKNMIADPTPRYKGNFCLFISNKENTILTHNIDRSFPLIKEKKYISNLYQVKNANVWADCFLKVNNEFNIEETHFESYKKDFQYYTMEDALDQVHHILIDTFKTFLNKNQKPIKIFLSGGLDTLTCFSYLDFLTKDYEIVDYEYHKFTHFYRHNWQEHIRKFWGYRQSHSWGADPTVLVTGACGDDYFMRGPHTTNLMLMYYGLDIFDLFKGKEHNYHYKYFHEQRHQDIFHNQKNDKSLEPILKKDFLIKDYIINRHVNDHQHWHLDETIFFTPFKNIEIAKILLGLPKKNFVNQVLDGEFNKQLISRINPNNLKFLSRDKNYQHLVFG